MTKQSMYSLLTFFALAMSPQQANALLLDCEINADKIYTCIEIGDTTTISAPADHEKDYDEKYNSYIKQARQSCTYKAPRKRTTGKGYSGAQRSEELKAANKDYDDCIRNKARQLWRQKN